MENYTIIELDEAIFDGNILVNTKKVYIPFEKIEGIGAIVINRQSFCVLMVGVHLKQYILTNTNEEIRKKNFHFTSLESRFHSATCNSDKNR